MVFTLENIVPGAGDKQYLEAGVKIICALILCVECHNLTEIVMQIMILFCKCWGLIHF